MLIYIPSFITILKPSLMVTRNCVIHVQNLYDVTKLILSKVVVISTLDIITDSHKWNSAFSEPISMQLKSFNALFSLVSSISNLSKSDEECRNCRTSLPLESLHYIDVPGTGNCCTHRVEIFRLELYSNRWRNTEMAAEITSRHFVSYGCR